MASNTVSAKRDQSRVGQACERRSNRVAASATATTAGNSKRAALSSAGLRYKWTVATHAAAPSSRKYAALTLRNSHARPPGAARLRLANAKTACPSAETSSPTVRAAPAPNRSQYAATAAATASAANAALARGDLPPVELAGEHGFRKLNPRTPPAWFEPLLPQPLGKLTWCQPERPRALRVDADSAHYVLSSLTMSASTSSECSMRSDQTTPAFSRR